MTSGRRNCITHREGMAEEQVTLLSFRERFFLSFGRHKSHLMWLRRVDGGCLSYGAPALPAHLHLLPAPENRTAYNSIMNRSKHGLKMNCENSSFETTPAPTHTNLIVGKYRHKCH